MVAFVLLWWPKATWGGGEGLSFVHSGHSPPLREVRAGVQGRHLTAGLLAVPHSIISNQGTHSQPRKCTVKHGACCVLAGCSWLLTIASLQSPDRLPASGQLAIKTVSHRHASRRPDRDESTHLRLCPRGILGHVSAN